MKQHPEQKFINKHEKGIHKFMVEVFKTNVHKISHANRIINLLLQQFPGNKINFDINDCDKIFRIEV